MKNINGIIEHGIIHGEIIELGNLTNIINFIKYIIQKK
jgi:hypothetical protein